MAKILVIRFTSLKYFVHCIPAFAAIRKKHKNDEVTILTEKSLIKFCKKSGYFDKVWLDTKPTYLQPFGLYDIISRLKAGKFDIVYDLQNDIRSEWYFKLMGFRKPKWNSSIVSWCSHYSRPEENISYQDIIHNQIRMMGVDEMPLINISHFANEEADSLPENYFMICAGGDRENLAHKWALVKYAQVIDYMYEKHNLKAVLVGDNWLDKETNIILSSQCIKTKPIDFSGKTSLNGIIAVAKKAKFCLGNETAPTHVATLTGTKTIMICSRFSPPELVAPQVKNLAVIEEAMLENIDYERVVNAIEEFAFTDPKENTFKTFKHELS